MVIGSHNSWSYLKATRWWLRPFQFTARCQRVDIRRQYTDYGVRCFDLRIRFDEYGYLQVAHGRIVYDIEEWVLEKDLKWLSMKGDCYVRVIHEIRRESEHTRWAVKMFQDWCRRAVDKYTGIQFWCGRNLADWIYDYDFGEEEPTCWEVYASVCQPKWIDDWWPWWFAWRNNRKIFAATGSQHTGQDIRADILLIDYVDIR